MRHPVDGPRSPAELEAVVAKYVADVLEGRRRAGRLERLAVERHVRDLEDGPARGLWFNRLRALRVLWWFEHRLVFSKGRWAGRPFRLEGWQAFALWGLAGWHRTTPIGPVLRFRTAYISTARKNGKSELMAGVALCFLDAAFGAIDDDGLTAFEIGAEVYSAATTRDQAAIVWKAGFRMVKRSPRLRAEIEAHPSRHVLVHGESDGSFKALASKSDRLDGLGPYCVVVDELHAHKDGTLWDVLKSGAGAMPESLQIAATTAGANRRGVCYEVESDAVKVLERVYDDDSIFALIFRPDDADDPFAEEAWEKANPNWGVSVDPAIMEIDALVAAQNPGRKNEFLRKRANVWTAGTSALFSMKKWDECDGQADWKDLEGLDAFVAFDLGSTKDTTAMAVAVPLEDGTVAVRVRAYVPLDTMDDAEIRGPRERELLKRWIRDGLVTATPGDMVDYGAMILDFANLVETLCVREAIFDRWQAAAIIAQAEQMGVEVVGFGQGYKDMSPAIATLEVLVGRRTLRHNGCPLLRWYASNAAAKTDPAGNRKFDKSATTARIDGIVAAAMAVDRAVRFSAGSSGGVVHTEDEEAEDAVGA